MDLRTFSAAFVQIAEEKGIPQEKVLETIELALAAAYKRDYAKRTQQVRVQFDPETGNMQVWQVYLVVDPEEVIIPEEQEREAGEEREAEKQPQKTRSQEPGDGRVKEGEEVVVEGEQEKIRFNADRHMFIADARKIKQDIHVGEELLIPLEPHDEFGRIAAQTAKQVIIQRLREAERDAIFSEYSSKEGEIVSGIVQRVEGRTVHIDLGRAIGTLFPQDQIPREFCRVGKRMRFYLTEVSIGARGPQIILSRSHPRFVSKLFEIEVPEAASGSVVIKAVAREAGSRTKIAVESLADGVDPIGAFVGQRGTRVMTVIGELGGEKIDVIQWDEDPEVFIAHALSPAKVSNVDLVERSIAIVSVPEDQLSLAIGKEGQNVRLAAKLTGWKIDIRGAGGEKVEGGEAVPETEEAVAPEMQEGLPSGAEEIVSPEGESQELIEQKSEGGQQPPESTTREPLAENPNAKIQIPNQAQNPKSE